MNFVKSLSIILSLLLASPATAQWQVPNHAMPIGRGIGVTGFGSAAPGVAGTVPMSNGIGVDATFQPVTNASFVNSFVVNHTIAQADCGGIVQMGSGSTWPLTLTLPSISGFTGVCPITILGQASRGVQLSGFSSIGLASPILLWPTKTFSIAISNGAWALTGWDGRYKLQSAVTCHVDKTNGSNSNDCLATGSSAVQDAQTAYNIMMQQWDLNGFTPIIGMATGQNHTVALGMGGVPLGSNLIQMSPDSNASFTMSNAADCISIADGAELDLRLNAPGASGGATFSCNTGNSTANSAIYLHNQTVVLDLEGGPPIWNPGGTNDTFLLCDGYCQYTIANGVTQNGGTALHLIEMLAGGHGTVSGTLSGTTGSLSGIFFVFGGALVNSGYSSSGWTTPGVSQFIANSTVITNGITPQGGYGTLAAGNTGTACTANTSTNC